MDRAKSQGGLSRIDDQVVFRLRKMIESELRFAPEIEQYYQGLDSLYMRWEQDASTPNPSLEGLVGCFVALREFDAGLSSASLESLSQQLLQISEQVDQQFPDRLAMVKLRKTKIVRSFESERRYNLDQVMDCLYAVTARWLRFWDSLLEILPPDAPATAICERTRAGFARFQQSQAFRQAAATYQDQIEQLRRATKGVDGDFAFLNEVKLHYCAAGSVLAGTLEAPVKSQGLLFLFEKNVVLMKTGDRTVKSDALLNFWMLRSPMFPGGKVVEVLGTQFSFAFDTTESDWLLRAWGGIKVPIPIDFGIFQRIALAPVSRELDWIEVDQ
jgi:hypothetical protein